MNRRPSGGMPTMNYAVIVSAIILSVFFDFNPVQSGAGAAAAEAIQPLITTSELVVGMNRFAFGLLKDHKLLEGANVTLRLYAMDGSEATLTAELNVPYQVISNFKQQASPPSPSRWNRACTS